MTPGQVGERVSAVSLVAVSQPPFRNELVGIFEVVGVVGHAVPHPDHHRALGHLVAAYHCVSLHKKVTTRINDSGTVGEISSDLYGLSGCDILNLTFCRLDFHQLLIKIS